MIPHSQSTTTLVSNNLKVLYAPRMRLALSLTLAAQLMRCNAPRYLGHLKRKKSDHTPPPKGHLRQHGRTHPPSSHQGDLISCETLPNTPARQSRGYRQLPAKCWCKCEPDQQQWQNITQVTRPSGYGNTDRVRQLPEN